MYTDNFSGNKSQRNPFVDILKGIGIIAVVLGHSLNTDNPICEVIRKFVYIFHLPIFFFCCGYLYRKKKTKEFVFAILKNQYMKYVIVGMVAIGFIPLWNCLKVIAPISLYDIPHRLKCVFGLKSIGPLTGAMWFCELYIVANICYFIVNMFSQKIKIFLIAISGILGGVLCTLNIGNFYYFNLALLIQPVIFAGDFYKKHEVNMKIEYIKLTVLISAAIILLMNTLSGEQIELSVGVIYGGFLFYPMVAVGVVFCISLAKIINENKKMRMIISSIGRYSYGIMAFHFMIFKMTDFVMLQLNLIDKNALKAYPISAPNFSIIYFLLGVSIPWIGGMIYESIKVKIRLVTRRSN